jgi:predicted GIY-YIG superfamily endonuclease
MMFVNDDRSVDMTTTVYVLKLEGNRYYVGKTNNPAKRFEEHVRGDGAAWTRLHKPCKIERVIENASAFDEDKYTKEYMAKYGIDAVRGGSYVERELNDDQVYALQRELRMASDKCTKCGRSGHFAANCYAKTDVEGNKIEENIVYACEYCNKEFDSEKECARHELCHKYKGGGSVSNKQSNRCFRCGRIGHYASSCYAKTDSKGYVLDDDDDDDDDEDEDDYDNDE